MKKSRMLFCVGILAVIVFVCSTCCNRHRWLGNDANDEPRFQHALHIAVPGWATTYHNEHTVDMDVSVFGGSSDVLFEHLYPDADGYCWTIVDDKRVRYKSRSESHHFTWRMWLRIGSWHDGYE